MKPIYLVAANPEVFILRQWILWSTVLGCFSAGATFYVGSVHLLYFYPILLLNLALLVLLQSLWVPPGLLLLLGFTIFSGMAGVLQGTNTLALFLKSEIGLVFSSVYACAFLRFMGFNAAECFRYYAKVAFFIAVLGLAIYAVIVVTGNPSYRLQSIEYEPGEFCIVTLPALYYYADKWHRSRKGAVPVLLMLLAVLLSQSSIGFMGLFVGIYLFLTRFRFGVLVGPFVILVFGFTAYTLSAEFQLRLSDSVLGLTLLDSSSLNDSSFSLLSGAFVAFKSLLTHPLIGSGLGGVAMASDSYIGGLPGIDYVRAELWAIARGDGGSMMSRLITETGLPGLFLAFAFLYYGYPRNASMDRKQLANALLVYIFLKMLRSGVYFNPEVLILLTIYAVNGSRLLHRPALRIKHFARHALQQVEQQA